MDQLQAEEGPIQAFYRDSTIFMTGASGFMGLVMLEKLLRSCSDLRTVYILMRAKKGKDVHQRFKDLLDDPLFSRVNEEFPKYKEKVVPVEGDCSLPELGLSDADRALLQKEVNVVFHVAATVRFDEPLRVASAINVRGTWDVLRLARDMNKLKALVHVSTAYAHCHEKHIEERFYQPRMTHQKLLALVDALDDDALEKINPVVLDKWPNTYCFTKAIAEEIIRLEGKGLPVCIVRPSMVMNSAQEPFPGWVNNINGPAGVVVGSGLGILRTINVDVNTKADIVPVDMVSNATIVAAWETANSSPRVIIDTAAPNGDVSKTFDTEEPKVYNYVSTARNPITWGEFMDINEGGINYPSEHIMWYYCLFVTKYRLLHNIQKLLLHLLPALLVDAAAICIGRKPMLLKTYRKIHRFLDVTRYFSSQEWLFDDGNVQKLWSRLTPKEKSLFPFDIAEMEWRETVSQMIPGLRVYFLKDPLSTVPKAKIRYNRLKWLHYSVVAAVSLLLLRLCWWIVSFFL